MIEDLEWRYDEKTGITSLYAYDGHVWFPVPIKIVYEIKEK